MKERDNLIIPECENLREDACFFLMCKVKIYQKRLLLSLKILQVFQLLALSFIEFGERT